MGWQHSVFVPGSFDSRLTASPLWCVAFAFATRRYPDPTDEFIKAKDFNFRLRKPRESSTMELAVKYADELATLKALGLPEDKTEADMLEMLNLTTGDVQNAYQLLSNDEQ